MYKSKQLKLKGNKNLFPIPRYFKLQEDPIAHQLQTTTTTLKLNQNSVPTLELELPKIHP